MQRSTAKALFELLSSMRFAISLLTILAIASVIGTVIQQNQPFNAYLNQFGPFWFPVFEKLGLYSVYNAGWFLVILAFLVLSTSLCIVRQSAPMLREMRSYREHAREVSLRQFAHQAELPAGRPLAEQRERVDAYLAHTGFRARADEREDGVLVAAKQGSLNRAGYFLAHGAIVLICIGGLLDGNLPLKVQMWLGGKQTTTGNQLIADIPASARLGENNWSFRANLFIPEGRSANVAVLSVDDGILLQELPFTVSLKKFHVDHYENGMPKRFASDILVTDDETGESFEHTIEVNHPLTYKGVVMYQASFEDGGSLLKLTGHNLLRDVADEPLQLEGRVGDTLRLEHPRYDYALELTSFSAFNVEDMGSGEDSATGVDRLREHLGSGAARTDSGRDLRNIGPSFTFKLRDEAGQAREFQNYMQPIERDGRWYLYTGMRETQAEPFRYLRLPVDEDGRIDTWLAIQRWMFDPARRDVLAHRMASASFGDDPSVAPMRDRLVETASHTLALFSERGYETVGRFIEASVPAAERERAADVFVKILQGLVWEAWMMARVDAGLPALEINENRAAFLRDTLAALSDSLFYEAPLYLQLTGFEHLQATVLQVTRSPGKPLVYLGSLLLVLGVFAMLYIRERRLFVLLKHQGAGLVAMSSNRKAIDVDEAFQRHAEALSALLAPDSGEGRTDPTATR
ncbi:cytochrome c biogenesis protein ResB [Pseudothauera nasutitermitis]|uniref:Cytochrome c biogenesis protein ResB n=1 Tax=Pseudothauera nasutitermitis TaxID=2565930 RepID=A0A4V3WB89_9RHOO|nr:cytochrome c biogenesis protein ResB [Pseudothauera nasutitermitis]THF62357.1 cytochrome c biogenesis protein ResB [Pseudothauera nasutitermitis]